MAKRGGISGLALALASAGGFLVYAGLKDVSPLEGLRELAAGRLPAGRPPKTTPVSFDEGDGTGGTGGGTGGGSSGLESRIVTAARTHIGAPYVWAAHGPSSFDCSGLVTYVLHHDCGIDLSKWSGGCNNTHTVTGQYLVTNGLKTVPRSEAQSGDLACWPGHIGICLNKDRMINAPHAGANVREDAIWGAPIIRRVVSF